MFEKKGSARIGKVIERVKTDIVDLEKGIGEVDGEIADNDQVVEIARENLTILETETASKNATLKTARDMASNVSGKLKELLGTA